VKLSNPYLQNCPIASFKSHTWKNIVTGDSPFPPVNEKRTPVGMRMSISSPIIMTVMVGFYVMKAYTM